MEVRYREISKFIQGKIHNFLERWYPMKSDNVIVSFLCENIDQILMLLAMSDIVQLAANKQQSIVMGWLYQDTTKNDIYLLLKLSKAWTESTIH